MGQTVKPKKIELEGPKGRKDRDEHGRFVKGHKVPSPRAGRPARADITSMLIAVAEQAYTPDEIVDLLHETVRIARANEDWKGVFTVLQFVVNYAVGKPVQRTLTANVDPSFLQSLFEDKRDENDAAAPADGDVIDV